MLDNATHCPACNANWDGGSILESFIQLRNGGNPLYANMSDEQLKERVQELYSPPYRWSRCIGIEIRGEYDGLSYYKCPDCNVTFNRFTGKEEPLPVIHSQNKQS